MFCTNLQGQALIRSRDALATVGLVDRAGEWPSTFIGRPETTHGPLRARERPARFGARRSARRLDALARTEMQPLLEQVWLSNGFTAIQVTHDVTEAVALVGEASLPLSRPPR